MNSYPDLNDIIGQEVVWAQGTWLSKRYRRCAGCGWVCDLRTWSGRVRRLGDGTGVWYCSAICMAHGLGPGRCSGVFVVSRKILSDEEDE